MAPEIWKSREALSQFLRETVVFISEYEESGKKKYRYRNVWNPVVLGLTSDYIRESFIRLGVNEALIETMDFDVSFKGPGETLSLQRVCNIIVEIKGCRYPEEIIIVGAHYDSRVTMEKQRGDTPIQGDKTVPCHWNTPGANDNGSGIAALLAFGAAFAGKKPDRTLRLIAWVNEEFPFYSNRFAGEGKAYYADGMGSYRHAQRCADGNGTGRRENIIGVVALDTLGCYSQSRGLYPGGSPANKLLLGLLGFPLKKDYVAFLSDAPSKRLVHQFQACYDRDPEVRSFARSVPRMLNWMLRKKGGWSDDWAYWDSGYPGFTVTDTAYVRSANYHTENDTAAHMNFPEFSKVVWRLRAVIEAFTENKL